MPKIFLACFILFLFIYKTALAEECRSGFKRQYYKIPDELLCKKGDRIPDDYETGVFNLCEDTEVDHFISQKQAWCLGLTEEQRKKLASDPKNLKRTKKSINRSKGAKNTFDFIKGRPDNKLRQKLLIEYIDLKKNYGATVTVAETDELLKTAKNLLSSNSLANKKIAFKGKKVPIQDAIQSTSKNIVTRAGAGAMRNLTTMAAQRFPLGVGISLMIGVTAWDIHDACQTTTELDEINKAINPENDFSIEVAKVCSLEIPSSEEIMMAARTAPKDAWEKSKEWVPDWQKFQSFDFDGIQWNDYWGDLKQKSSDLADKTTGTSSKILESTKGKAEDLKGKLGSWFKSNE